MTCAVVRKPGEKNEAKTLRALKVDSNCGVTEFSLQDLELFPCAASLLHAHDMYMYMHMCMYVSPTWQ